MVQIGSVVKVHNDLKLLTHGKYYPVSFEKAGHTGEVCEIQEIFGILTYKVRFDDGSCWWFFPHQVREVP